MKEYALVAIWKKDPKSEAFEATRMCRGPAADLRVEIPLLPPNTLRICVIDNKEFERLAKLPHSRVDELLIGKQVALQEEGRTTPTQIDLEQYLNQPSEHSQPDRPASVES